ncbi:MAG: aminoglycoside phosphotransferase family protein [Methylococcaceae bacterium]|nr:aminoglycoside phosphotransferase family protein [Methylococcaceae bacterium]
MNLAWHRNQPEPHNKTSNIVKSTSPIPAHWAQTVLERFSQPDELAKEIRLAFHDKLLAEQFEIFDIQHVPGRLLKVLGRFLSNADKHAFTIVQVNFYSETDITPAFTKAMDEAIDSSRIARIESWNAIVRIFPEDAGLPGLGTMLDLNKVAQLLGEPETNANNAEWKMLSYQSGKRCALGYHYIQSGARYFGKIQDEKRAEITHNNLCLLWNNPTRRFQMPKPITYESDLGARWETFVDGQNLEKALETGELEQLVQLVISNLIYLHEQDLPNLSIATPEQIMARVEKKILRRMQSLIPELASRAEECLRQLKDNLSWTQDNQIVTLHGDFHIANFILNKEGLVFIDLDSLSKGDPCIDLALFGSRLMLRNLHHNDRLQETLQLVAQLPALYSELGGKPIRQETFAWYLSALLIGRQIKSCIRVDAPEKVTMISTLLDWAEDSLNCANKPTITLR